MATFKPAQYKKNDCIDQCVTNAIFDCFQVKGIYNGTSVDITIDQEQVILKDGDFEIAGQETVICFRRCQVPEPCGTVSTCGINYTIDKVIHSDQSCICATVNKCGVC